MTQFKNKQRVLSRDNDLGTVIDSRYGALSGNTYYLVRWDCGAETEVTGDRLTTVVPTYRIVLIEYKSQGRPAEEKSGWYAVLVVDGLETVAPFGYTPAEAVRKIRKVLSRERSERFLAMFDPDDCDAYDTYDNWLRNNAFDREFDR